MTAPRDLDPATLRYLADQYTERAKDCEGEADGATPFDGEAPSLFLSFVAGLRVRARGWRNEAKRLRNLATRAGR